jgi:hypothetical protein
MGQDISSIKAPNPLFLSHLKVHSQQTVGKSGIDFVFLPQTLDAFLQDKEVPLNGCLFFFLRKPLTPVSSGRSAPQFSKGHSIPSRGRQGRQGRY